MNLFRWQKGRAESGYFKMLLACSNRFKFDLYLLKYPIGSFLDWHTDDIKGGKFEHWRFNFTLWKAKKGGQCQTIMPPTAKGSRWYLFRPDVNLHRVLKIEAGVRYVLSFGILLKGGE